jgi:hypothetical protein
MPNGMSSIEILYFFYNQEVSIRGEDKERERQRGRGKRIIYF